MTRCLSFAAVFVLALVALHPASASAQQLPESVKLGMNVSIVDDAGTEREGRVDSFSDDMIRIKRRSRIEEVSLRNIVRIEKPDSLRNGALTGFVVGATVGAVGGMILMHRDINPGILLWAAASQGAIYAGVGTAIDGMIRGRRTLYERGRTRETSIAPLVGPNLRGAVVRVSW